MSPSTMFEREFYYLPHCHDLAPEMLTSNQNRSVVQRLLTAVDLLEHAELFEEVILRRPCDLDLILTTLKLRYDAHNPRFRNTEIWYIAIKLLKATFLIHCSICKLKALLLEDQGALRSNLEWLQELSDGLCRVVKVTETDIRTWYFEQLQHILDTSLLDGDGDLVLDALLEISDLDIESNYESHVSELLASKLTEPRVGELIAAQTWINKFLYTLLSTVAKRRFLPKE